jgi:DNA invertase Pin-like site-specific DNA recombinase
MPAEIVKVLRCAIYTRKSTEHGLDQEFNSLDAQREACEAYIKSQASQGWRVLPQYFDDSAYSGGNLERPALKRLLREIELGRVDVVVVYKIDRLTRSLADFAKLVETFDARSISFVAVTQQFNTTTSMGRLTLNVLLSFAQFERELASERVRDKVAASRKKGKWTGGSVPLGYEAKNKKLVINKTEAEIVRTIFRLYLELKSFSRLVAELDRRKIVTKRRNTKVAKYQGGIPFTYGPLAYFLKNRIYIGQMHHGGKWFKGEHPAILDCETFDSVQDLLKSNRITRRIRHSRSKVQITLANSNRSKRPFEISWSPNPKSLAQIQQSSNSREPDPKLIKAIARAHSWLDQLSTGQKSSIEELAAATNYNPKVIRQGLRLAFLATDLTVAAATGGATFKLPQIPKLLPLSWHQQRQAVLRQRSIFSCRC